MRTANRPQTSLRRTPRLRRKATAVGHVSGTILIVASVGMLLSAGVDLIAAQGEASRAAARAAGTAYQTVAGELATAAGICLLAGLVLFRLTRLPDRLSPAAIHASVLIGWVALSFAGTLPYLLTRTFPSFGDALFESIAGFTTTASSVMTSIDVRPPGVLFWRAVTQWIGGIGVIVFAISVLPYLGVGGMELLQAESRPSSERLVPRLREVARHLVLLYLGFTVVVGFLYWAFGMRRFDAVVHAMTTVSTGGFSTHSKSFAHYDSGALEWVATVAMLVAGTNFALWWRALRGRPMPLLRAPEFRAYLAFTGFILATAVLWIGATSGYSHGNVRRTVFSVVSLSSTTGYTDADYDLWPGALRLLLLAAMALGGMAGSATGGFKIFRLLAVLGYARRQVFRQLHPRSVSVVRLGRETVPEEVASRVVGFFALFVAAASIATFLVAATSDLEPLDALAAVATAIGNVGPGMGTLGPTETFTALHPSGRGVLMVVMLLGRLEIFPVLLGGVALVRWLEDKIANVAR